MNVSAYIPHRRNNPDDDVVWPSRGRAHPEFSFAGALEHVPADDAAALTDVTRLLLRHGDAHTGRPAHIRVASTSQRLSLDLQDQECSLECLVHTEEFAAITATSGLRETHLSIDDRNGVHLQWQVHLATTRKKLA